MRTVSVSQAADGLGHGDEGQVDLFVGRRRGEREAQGGTGVGSRAAHGKQHVARLGGTAGARRAGRGRHPELVEDDEEGLALDAFHHQVGEAGCRRRPGHRLDDVGNGGDDAVDQAITATGHLRDRPAALGGRLESNRGGPRRGDCLGATTSATLLATSVEERGQCYAVTDHQGTGPDRAAELVGAHRYEVGDPCDSGHVEPRHGLDGVGVEPGARRPAPDQRCHLGQGLDGPDLVVDQHHRDEGHVRAEHTSQRVEVDRPVGGRPDLTQLDPEALGGTSARPEDGVVLEGRADDRPGWAVTRPEHPEDGKVVGLGASGREDHLARRTAQVEAEQVAGVVEPAAGATCLGVHACRVALPGLCHLQPGRHGGRDHGRRGGMVEVGTHAASLPGLGPGRCRPQRRQACSDPGSAGAYTGPVPVPSSDQPVSPLPMTGEASRADEREIARQRKVWTERAVFWDEHTPKGLDKVVDALVARAGTTDGAVIVDLGCGTGQVTFPLAPGAARVLGVDVSPKMIEILERHARERGDDNVEGVVCAIEQLDLPQGSVDLVVTNYVLHHLRDRDKAEVVRRAATWLKPGGRLVIGDMMFGRGTEARDWAIAATKTKAFVKLGPGGLWRIAKGVWRMVVRTQERPVSMSRWVAMLTESGFDVVDTVEVIAEGAVVVGVRRPR